LSYGTVAAYIPSPPPIAQGSERGGGSFLPALGFAAQAAIIPMDSHCYFNPIAAAAGAG